MSAAPAPPPPAAEGTAHQHRCHARLADLVHAVLGGGGGLPATPHRARLWLACLRSAPGDEPAEPYLLDPAAQVLRWREPQPLPEPTPAPAPAPAHAR